MDPGQEADLGGEGPHVVDAAAIHPLAVIQQPAAHDIFLQLIEAFLELACLLGIHVVEFFVHRRVDRAEPFVPDPLVVGVQGGADILDGEILDRLVHLRIRIVGGEIHLGLADFGPDFIDESDDLLVGGVPGHNAAEHGVVVDLIGAASIMATRSAVEATVTCISDRAPARRWD